MPAAICWRNPDVYIPVGQPGATGYDATRDTGVELVLKANNQNKIAPSFYNPWDLPRRHRRQRLPRQHRRTATPTIVSVGDPHARRSPATWSARRQQGVHDLVAEDPTAYWDTLQAATA